ALREWSMPERKGIIKGMRDFSGRAGKPATIALLGLCAAIAGLSAPLAFARDATTEIQQTPRVIGAVANCPGIALYARGMPMEAPTPGFGVGEKNGLPLSVCPPMYYLP